jgi:hypothetical protein
MGKMSKEIAPAVAGPARGRRVRGGRFFIIGLIVDAAARGKPSRKRNSRRIIASAKACLAPRRNTQNEAPDDRHYQKREEGNVKQNILSLQRRHLMMAGLAGMLAPACVFAAPVGGASGSAPRIADALVESDGPLVVSGRVLGPDRKPVAGAEIEAWQFGETVARARATTDADGRFVFTTTARAGHDGSPHAMSYRISHPNHAALESRIEFVRPQLQLDEAGAWRTTLSLALA